MTPRSKSPEPEPEPDKRSLRQEWNEIVQRSRKPTRPGKSTSRRAVRVDDEPPPPSTPSSPR